MFTDNEEKDAMQAFLEDWTDDPQNMKAAFVRLKEKLVENRGVVLSFNPRPGVSYSLRANVKSGSIKDRPLFALVDIVDDQAESRWLSVCFYSDLVSDPEDEGNLVPEGILGEDGYCFDLFEYDREFIDYVEQRIDEAYKNALN